ncbi:MAG: hypothetical protein FJ087_07800 [Deltaproteobacteria bacterium]|nr:hypothetical protein [Deltaproteobacteria bacterium]
MHRVSGAFLVLAFAIWACGGSGGGGGLKGALSGSKLAGAAKGLKKDSSGKVGGKEGTNSTAAVDAPATGGGTAAPNNIQAGDSGDETFSGVSYDIDGDGDADTVDVTVDDETGDTYYSFEETADVDGDGDEETVDVLVVDNGDGTYDIYVEVPGEGTVVCTGATESDAGNCQACDSAGQCQDLAGDDLYGDFEEEQTTEPPPNGNVCDQCVELCEANCEGEACAYCDEGCAEACGQ